MKSFLSILFFSLVAMLPIGISAHPGIGIVMDSQGNVYYTDLTHVWKISTDGNVSLAVKDVHTHELYLDEDDNLYGQHEWYEGETTDKWKHYVWCLSNSGLLEKTFPPTDGLPKNNTLVRDSQGNMFWPEKYGGYEVLKKETHTGQISLQSSHKFKDIRWSYYSRYDDNLYVVDYLQLKKVTPAGEVSILVNNLKEKDISYDNVGNHHYVMGVWSDASKDIYVALFGAQKVKKISSNGTIKTIYKSPADWSPSGGLMTADGSLWIMEFSKGNKIRIVRISPNKEERIFRAPS